MFVKSKLLTQFEAEEGEVDR